MSKAIRHKLIILLICIAVPIVLILILIGIKQAKIWYHIYEDIGATPFSTPETEIIAGKDTNDKFSEEDISKAMNAVIETFDSDYKPHGSLYLTKLWYNSEINSEITNETDEQIIYISCNLYHGECRFGNGCGFGTFRLYTAGYWTLHRADEHSEWICYGWGQG